MKCDLCKKENLNKKIFVRKGGYFCSRCVKKVDPIISLFETITNRFEEIKQMAWDMYVTEANKYSHDRETCFANFEDCWWAASHFYDFAKEKEEEVGEETTMD